MFLFLFEIQRNIQNKCLHFLFYLGIMLTDTLEKGMGIFYLFAVLDCYTGIGVVYEQKQYIY